VSGLALSAAARRAKESALQRHRSQVEPLSERPGDEPVVPPGFRDHFRRDLEVYVDEAAGGLDRGFFDGFYAAGADPWGFESRWYEERKRAITLAQPAPPALCLRLRTRVLHRGADRPTRRPL